MTGNFIEPGTQASYWQWLFSMGTNSTCYDSYQAGLTEENKVDQIIEIVRTIIYALACPLKFTFFYWSILLFILHKFNFNKPVLKIILYHFIFRCIGDILDKLGNLMPRYYANIMEVDPVTNEKVFKSCQTFIDMSEKHPLKWLITRQLAVIFWFTGEIFADWYPLLRTRAVAREAKSMWLVYTTCIIFNLSKVSMMIYHFTLSPSSLYNEYGEYNSERVTKFYYIYWIIHLIIIYASVIYDFSVFYVLKRNVFGVQSEIGFLKKFRSMSEFRISISVIICIVFLPLISTTIILKYYFSIFKGMESLNFSFDEIRQLIANVQYFMIFIDQILLIISKEEYQHTSSYNTNQPYPSGYYYSSKSNISNNSGNYNGQNNSNNNNGFNNSSNNIFKNTVNNKYNNSINDNGYKPTSNIHYQNLMKMNSEKSKQQYDDNLEYTPIMHTPMLNYNSNNANFANQNIRITQEMSKPTPAAVNNFNNFNNNYSYKKKTMADYDEYNGPNSNEWNYL